MTKVNINFLRNFINAFELFGLCLLIILALLLQFHLKELPCPLCLLQRFGFMGIILALFLNSRFGYNPSHVGLSLLFAVFTALVALRQIALHVVPGSGVYGSSVFGLHLYTWSFVMALIFIIFNCMMLSIGSEPFKHSKDNMKFWNNVRIALFISAGAVITINIISTLLECGFTQCPDNPISYMW
jgi:disulfide bond formation protein DsbB